MADEGARESFSGAEGAAEALAAAREAAAAAGLGPSHEQARDARAYDGPEGNFSSETAGLQAAASELAQARETFAARPDPPSASDLVAGPGEAQEVSLPGDPRDPKSAISALNAAKSLSALHHQQQQEIDQLEQEFARQNISWSDALDGKLDGTVRAASEASAPQAEPQQQQPAPDDEQQRLQDQVRFAQQQQHAAFNQMSAEAAHQKYLIAGAVREVAALFPEIRSEQDLIAVRMRNPARAAQFTQVVGQLEAKAMQAEWLTLQARTVGERANADEAARQDKLFEEKYQDFAKDAQLQKQAMASLKDAGFSEEELTRTWNGEAPVYLRDHRTQAFIADHVRLQNENAALKARLDVAQQSVRRGGRVPGNLPPMMAPGTANIAPDRGVQAQMRNLEWQLGRATTSSQATKLGAELLAAHRQAAKRGY